MNLFDIRCYSFFSGPSFKMNCIKYLTTLLSVLILSITTAAAQNTEDKTSMLFQVVQGQMVFDSSTVESATVVPVDTASDLYGVQLKLKNEAAAKFGDLTAKNIGKQLNIIIEGMVISSPIIRSKLGPEFLVAGLTKVQADKFVKSIVPLKQ